MKTKVPFLLHILAILFLLTAFVHFLGVFQAIRSWNWLQVVDYQPNPIYSVFKNAALGLGFLDAAALLWMRLTWAPRLDGIIVITSALWFWLDRLALTRNPLPFKDHIFYLIATVLILVFCLLSLESLKPFMRSGDKLRRALETGVNNEETPD